MVECGPILPTGSTESSSFYHVRPSGLQRYHVRQAKAQNNHIRNISSTTNESLASCYPSEVETQEAEAIIAGAHREPPASSGKKGARMIYNIYNL